MPIFAQVHNRASVHDALSGARLDEDKWKYEETRADAIHAFKVDAQVAAELYYRGTQDKYDLRTHFGALRLPYPSMWIEWKMPPVIQFEGKEVPVGHDIRQAALLTEESTADGYRLTAGLFVLSGGKLFAPLVFDLVTLDSDGSFLRRHHSSGYQGRTGIQFLGDLNVAYLTVSLMHCKNVSTDQATVAPRGSSNRRKRIPAIDYHTIVLPGMPRGAAQTGSEFQDVMALHRVRGHFKTYTADAPLLGKHTGKYWWGWQVRGSKKNGISVTDYKIGAPELESLPA